MLANNPLSKLGDYLNNLNKPKNNSLFEIDIIRFKIEWGSVNHAENRYPSVTKHKIRMCVQGGHSLRSPVKIDNIIKEKSSISHRISDNQHQASKFYHLFYRL